MFEVVNGIQIPIRRKEVFCMNALTKTIVLLSVACVICTTAFAAKKDDPQKILDRLPKGTIIQRDIVYATNGERKMLLDVYRPKSDEPLPLVI